MHYSVFFSLSIAEEFKAHQIFSIQILATTCNRYWQKKIHMSVNDKTHLSQKKILRPQILYHKGGKGQFPRYAPFYFKIFFSVLLIKKDIL